MAIYHLQAKVVQRSKGRSVIAAAAYRAAEALYDAELGRTQNFLAKTGVVHSEILLPSMAPSRWLDRETLWNEVTSIEKRHDAVLAREIELALPRELSQAEAIALARDFVREQFVARGMVADLNVHWGQAADGSPQPHAHVLLTMRRIDPEGGLEGRRGYDEADRGQDPERGARRAPHLPGNPGADAGGRRGRSDPAHLRGAEGYRDSSAADGIGPQGGEREAERIAAPGGRITRLMAAARLRAGIRRLQAAERAGFGLKERAWNDKALLRLWRERWAEMANARLAELGHDVRIDHRSHAARGLDLEPQNKIGPAGARRARRGEEAERADEHRAIARRNGEWLLAEPELVLRALTLQQSTFTRQDMARVVDRQTDGAAQFAAVMAKVEASPELVRVGTDGRGRDRFSTREMTGLEQRMMATAMALTRRTTHRVDATRRRRSVQGEARQLSEEQALAYLHVTRSRDLVVLSGIAGGGKSTLLGPAREVWEEQGYRVRGAALSGIAAEGLEGGTGIESRTIASWDYAWNGGRELLTAGDILVLDEAGMVGSRQMARILERVREAGAKLVLVGDAEQLQAIEAGAAFRAIAERVGVVAIREPVRQKTPWQREATKELATGRTAGAIDRYEEAGLVHRHATREAARAGVLAAWREASQRNPRQSQLIMAHERADVRALNEAARALRREAGELGPDHVVQTELGALPFAAGDRVYFLRNDRGLGVKNGTLGSLTRIDGSRLAVCLDGRDGTGTGRGIVLDLGDYAALGHGYAATIHKNQGATADQAHVLATPGMDRHLAYVALSRHRHAVLLHWSEEDFRSSESMRERLARERAKDTTLDYGEADPIAAFAETRGLAPVSEIIVPDAQPTGAPRGKKDRFAGLTLKGRDAGEAGPPHTAPVGDGVSDQPSSPRPAHRTLIDALDDLARKLQHNPPPFMEMMEAAYQESEARKRASQPRAPMVPAKPYRPVTEAEVAALVGEPVSLRAHVQIFLEKAYRDPAAAWARLEALLQTHGGEEAVAAILKQQGPELLGRLRGSLGLFASGRARDERLLAELPAKVIADELLRPRAQHRRIRESYRARLEAERQRETVEVPGLTEGALAAIGHLEKAGAEVVHPRLQRGVPVDQLTPGEIAEAARVAAVWSAMEADPALREELAVFRKAAEARLGDEPDLWGHPGVGKAYHLSRVLTRAEQLAARHGAVETVRAACEQAEVLRRVAEETRQRAAEQAKQALKLRDPQPDRPRPRPSGPSMG